MRRLVDAEKLRCVSAAVRAYVVPPFSTCKITQSSICPVKRISCARLHHTSPYTSINDLSEICKYFFHFLHIFIHYVQIIHPILCNTAKQKKSAPSDLLCIKFISALVFSPYIWYNKSG